MMGDISKIAWPRSPWDREIGKWKQGKEVDKARIVGLLENGEAVPVKANALLAGLITGEIKARKGNKPGRFASPLHRKMLVEQVEVFATMIADPSKIPAEHDKEFQDWIKALHLQSHGTPHQKARKIVADWAACSDGLLRSFITERNNRLRAIAEEHGVTLAAVKKALKVGEP